MMTLHEDTTVPIPSAHEWASITSGHPEEVLDRLDSINIEWYLADTGDLLIRQWRLGAENFVPAERVAELRENRELPADANHLEWLSKNLSVLRAKYAGQWIARDARVTLAADNLQTLMIKIAAHNLENPFITQIPAKEIVWTTTYAH